MKTIPCLLALLVAAGFAVSGASAQETDQPYQHQKKRPPGEAGRTCPDGEKKRPVLHSPEKREMMRARMLERFDTDKDGTLSDAEKAAARAAHEERMKEHRAKFLERFDTDKDGKLSEAEKAAARAEMEKHRKAGKPGCGGPKGNKGHGNNTDHHDSDNPATGGGGPDTDEKKP